MLRSTNLGCLKSPKSYRAVLKVTVGPVKHLTPARKISGNPTESFTRLSDENDPQRDAFFKYSWGSWLTNDKQEKEKRITKFSIEGLTDVLNDLHSQAKELAKTAQKHQVLPPSYNRNLTVSLPHNSTLEHLGTVNPNERVKIVSMASIHEGKHHRIYKVDTNLDKSFVLRIPYSLDNENSISYRLKSEVATMDFADLKLGIKVPKIFCYGVNKLNPVRQPFMLQEYIDGDLLMREWSPLVENDTNGKPHESLQKVLGHLSDFQSKLASLELNNFGSLYFAKDNEKSTDAPYEGETNPDLQGRWSIGPTTERCFWRRKSALKFDELLKFLGPWSISSPLDIVKNIGLVEAENAKARLALKQAGSSPEAVKEDLLKEQTTSFENLAKLSPHMFDINTTTIPNMKELLKPRLRHPDIDPMNVIISKNDDKTPYLLDFEGTSIKPFILQNSPQFVAYDGPKVYNVKEDVPDYEKLSDADKAQYDFMYKRTRNQHLWEAALNERLPKLISAVAPPVKLLRSPYISSIERKTDEEYLLIDEALLQLKEVWDIFAKNGLVKSAKFPLEISEEQIEKHTKDLNAFHERLISTPFAATRGWVPQDMFDNLVKAGLLIKDKNGDHIISTDKAT
ncbi:hypothetical protein HG535_0E03300 [Zygotorulaspora mrakii]|uniref:Altered inheritance of mitochondria protein 9, mitochondrial n=1 Tax=Zygotorulaspora mrakii TaxID=42260 RepID=A0A7H9B4E7_ZYGMR|nr:uncharacterized protein HG535_0E03300 [Zygotorulaspora mrakii]QLG73246.1 hypothetical protein HG535_0E03300 [Zygotorulaspora mrakii]